MKHLGAPNIHCVREARKYPLTNDTTYLSITEELYCMEITTFKTDIQNLD